MREDSLNVSRGGKVEIRNYSKITEIIEQPNLVQIQTKSYAAFLQEDVLPNKRKNLGLEAILRETFPIKNYDETISLQYIKYVGGKLYFKEPKTLKQGELFNE